MSLDAKGNGTNEGRLAELAEWRERFDSSEQEPRELFEQVSKIALCMSYDMVDKLRWWEKETLKLPPDEVAQRLAHMAVFLDRLKAAYLEFSEADF